MATETDQVLSFSQTMSTSKYTLVIYLWPTDYSIERVIAKSSLYSQTLILFALSSHHIRRVRTIKARVADGLQPRNTDQYSWYLYLPADIRRCSFSFLKQWWYARPPLSPSLAITIVLSLQPCLSRCIFCEALIRDYGPSADYQSLTFRTHQLRETIDRHILSRA